MTRHEMGRHALVLLATLAGIVGMATVFNGVSHATFHMVTQGLPPLLLGLWWAGRELGRSMLAARAGQEPRRRRNGRRPFRRGTA